MALNRYPHVYSPIQVGNMTLKNRIQFSPIVSNHADYVTGRVTNDLLNFVGMQAKTGCGLVTIGSTPIDFDRARDFYGCLSVTSDDDLPGLSLLTNEVHKYGCKLSTELTHGGQWADPRSLNGKPAFVPSVVPEYHDPHKFEEISRTQMLQVIDNWLEATDRCLKTGFDMIMIHCAHGNLLSSFLSTEFNRRTDKYGGSPENRWRYPLEVIEAVSNHVNGRIPIEIRVVGNEWIPNGTSLEERIAFLKEAQKYVDMVIVSAGTLLFDNEAMCNNMPGYYTPNMLNVPYAAAMKEALDIPVSVVGGISTLDEAEEIIASGKADIVAMAKALMADELFVEKGRRGQEKEIRPCMRCLYCLRRVGIDTQLTGCAVNPRMGWESRYPMLYPVLKKKKVAVVGGGPGGMEAAQILTQRGHDVVLFEKTGALGGHLPEASALPMKDGFRRYLEYTVRKTNESGAEIRLNTEATPELLSGENFDALIVATGAETIRPGIPGIDGENVVSVIDVDRGNVKCGGKVVMCGAGLSGAECALGLAMEGHDVTMVDIIKEDQLCESMVFFSRLLLKKQLRENGVKFLPETSVCEFVPGGVKVKDKDGNESVIPADTAVLAFGMRPNEAYVESLRDAVPESYVIGDARKVGLIGDATNQAYEVCYEL